MWFDELRLTHSLFVLPQNVLLVWSSFIRIYYLSGSDCHIAGLVHSQSRYRIQLIWFTVYHVCIDKETKPSGKAVILYCLDIFLNNVDRCATFIDFVQIPSATNLRVIESNVNIRCKSVLCNAEIKWIQGITWKYPERSNSSENGLRW